MPEKRTIAKARKDKRAGKAPSTQAGEFVHEEIRKIRRGEHGARSPQQAIAIGLSKARRAGVALRPPRKGQAKARTRRSAAYAYAAGQHKRKTHHRPRVPPRHARRCGRKALPGAPPRHAKRRAPGRDIASSAPGHLNRARRLGRAALPRSATEPTRSWARFVRAELLNQRRFICIPNFWPLPAHSL
jgi:hypothetical protein